MGISISGGVFFSGNISMTPQYTACAPTGISASTVVTGTVVVYYTSATNLSGLPIVSYTVNSAPPDKSVTVAATSSSTGSIIVSGLSNYPSYIFTVQANNAAGAGPASTASNVVFPTYGQSVYTTAGTYSWTAPPSVTSISVVAVGGGGGQGPGATAGGGGNLSGAGGGGLAYINNYTVSSGTSYTVIVGAGHAGYGNSGAGQPGAVRIIWPGTVRLFPSTNVCARFCGQ